MVRHSTVEEKNKEREADGYACICPVCCKVRHGISKPGPRDLLMLPCQACMKKQKTYEAEEARARMIFNRRGYK